MATPLHLINKNRHTWKFRSYLTFFMSMALWNDFQGPEHFIDKIGLHLRLEISLNERIPAPTCVMVIIKEKYYEIYIVMNSWSPQFMAGVVNWNIFCVCSNYRNPKCLLPNFISVRILNHGENLRLC